MIRDGRLRQWRTGAATPTLLYRSTNGTVFTKTDLAPVNESFALVTVVSSAWATVCW
jgi:hypothetical protein